jgi:hypothetical protein
LYCGAFVKRPQAFHRSDLDRRRLYKMDHM